MDIRLVAYRRELLTDNTYNVTEFELDLKKNPNIVVNYNWLDLKSPDKRKSSFSQTIKLPFTNRNNKFFENWFDVNLDTLVFNTKTKFEAILYVDSIQQLKGFIELKSILLNARLYDVAIFGDTANFFTDIKDNKLKDAFRTQDTSNPNLFLEDKQLDHTFTLENINNSWTTGLSTVLSTTTNDVMYPIIDYGHTRNPYSDSMFWDPADLWTMVGQYGGDIQDAISEYALVRGEDLKPAIRLQRLFHIIAQKAGYQIKSSFLGINDTAGTPITDTQWFSRLFMTLSTEHKKVQTLFNTSTGSETPFIGFQATLTSSFSESIQLTTDPPDPFSPWQEEITEFTASNINVNNEAYDPNNLFTNDMTNWGVSNPPGFSNSYTFPSIMMPLDNGGNDTLLPTGSMAVLTVINLNIPNVTIEGTTLDYVEVSIRWYRQSNNQPQGNGWTGNVSLDQNQGIFFTEYLPCDAGEIYYMMVQFSVVMAATAQSVNVTFNTVTIQTLQTDEVGLMSGGLNGEVQMYHNMPDMTQSDFVKDLINRFNLIISTDPDNERLLLIEPYKDYISDGSTLYWTDKLDKSKEMVVKSTNQFQYKHLKYSDLKSKDILNERYHSTHNAVYGEYNEFRRNEFAGKEFKNFSKMSPFIAQGIGQRQGEDIVGGTPNENVAIAYCFKAEENEERSAMDKMLPKIFYYSGTPIDVSGTNPDTNTPFDFHLLSNQYIDTNDARDCNNKFPLCLQYDLNTLGDVTASTRILNWTYYSPNFNSGFTFNFFGDTYSTHGYFEDYWSQYINELYSDEGRIMECYINLDTQDIRLFTEKGFQNSYYIKNTLWRVINIQGHLMGANKSTKVTLLKVIEKLPVDCGAIPTITKTGLITYVDAGTGLSTTINNNCCEEVNSNWTFIQNNDTTGIGQCYSENPITNVFTEAGGEMQPMPSLLPNMESNFNVQSTTGNANVQTFYIQAQTLDSTTVTNFSINGLTDKIKKIPMGTMNYIKVKLMGSIVSGTNSSRVGYFEYDAVFSKGQKNVTVSTTTLLKSNKDTAFTTPTVTLTNFDNFSIWNPIITGGASEMVNWIAKVEIMQQKIGYKNGTFKPSVKAVYQNYAGILLQNNYLLEWN